MGKGLERRLDNGKRYAPFWDEIILAFVESGVVKKDIEAGTEGG